MSQMQFGAVNITAVIQSMLPVLNTAESLLANYLLEHIEDVVHQTIDQLAKNSGTSYSTVSRFCQRMGFSGFKDFKKRITSDVIYHASNEEEFSSFEMDRGDSMHQICEKTFRLFTGVLRDCASLLNLDVLKQAIDAILNANVLYIIGAGASAASALYAHTQLLRLGIPCTVESDPTLYLMNASLMREGNVLLAISSSGRTSSVVTAARMASEKGARVISISDFLISPLQRHSDTCLYTTSRNSGKNVNVDMPLTIGQIAIIDILYSCCVANLGERGKRNYLATKEAADTGKSK